MSSEIIFELVRARSIGGNIMVVGWWQVLAVMGLREGLFRHLGIGGGRMFIAVLSSERIWMNAHALTNVFQA